MDCVDQSSLPTPSTPQGLQQSFDETLVIFDWDDTLLPTSWLERINALSITAPLRPEVQRQLATLAQACTTTLNFAATLGTVILITNSAPGWVDQSCQLFMPQMCQLMRGHKIFAKPLHAPLTFKINAFKQQCKKQFRNVISIGDGDAERMATLRLQSPLAERKMISGASPGGAEAQRRTKSLKLIDVPTCEQLILEHEMLQARLADICAFQGNLDVKARFPAAGMSTNPGTPVGGCRPACTLVHLTRPTPAPMLGLGPSSPASSPLQSPLRSPGIGIGGQKEDAMAFRPVRPRTPGAVGNSQLPPLAHGEKATTLLDYSSQGRVEKGGNGFLFTAPDGTSCEGASAGKAEAPAELAEETRDPEPRMEQFTYPEREHSPQLRPNALRKAQQVASEGRSRSLSHSGGKRSPALLAGRGPGMWGGHALATPARAFLKEASVRR